MFWGTTPSPWACNGRLISLSSQVVVDIFDFEICIVFCSFLGQIELLVPTIGTEPAKLIALLNRGTTNDDGHSSCLDHG